MKKLFSDKFILTKKYSHGLIDNHPFGWMIKQISSRPEKNKLLYNVIKEKILQSKEIMVV